jgi:hypothetical protein
MEDYEGFEKKNPNKIGELLGFKTGDVETFPNRVYRSVQDRAAIDDLLTSGVVRSKHAAGIDSKYGDAVYWSRGDDEKYHNVQAGGYLIEAPYQIANERSVTIDDLTAVYHKTKITN